MKKQYAGYFTLLSAQTKSDYFGFYPQQAVDLYTIKLPPYGATGA
jgi:hypothetical protein